MGCISFYLKKTTIDCEHFMHVRYKLIQEYKKDIDEKKNSIRPRNRMSQIENVEQKKS